MPDEKPGDKSEPASPRKRQDARERGHVAKSQDLTAALVLLSSFLALHFVGGYIVDGVVLFTKFCYEHIADAELTPESMTNVWGLVIAYVGVALLPFFAVVFIGGVAANVFQIGFLFTAKALEPSLEKLNPFTGIKRVFSLRSVVRLVGSMFKLAVIGGVMYWTVMGKRDALFALPEMDVTGIVAFLVKISMLMGFRVSVALVLLALLDYAYQRWQYEKDLMMSKEEIKEEMKKYEGDPRMRERRKAIHRQVAYQRMMAAVPKATVVITNPTELAIALKYEPGDQAPTCVAKGAGYVAQRIRELALESGIPIRREPPLAQALFKTVKVGQQIPESFYKVVAEILAWVYNLKGKTAVSA